MSSITLRWGIAACVWFTSSMATAQLELTSNGDFETGDTSGWVEFITGSQTFVATSDAASGTTAGMVTNTDPGTPAVIKQANLGIGVVEPGQEVTISFDAKGVQGPGGVVFAELFSELDGGGTSSSVILGSGPLGLTDQYQPFSFTSITGPDVSGGVSLQLNAATGAFAGSTAEFFIDNVSLTIVVESMFAADFNGDGTVDLLDLDILGAGFGGQGTSATGDANGDGQVDLLDLDILGSQFGMTSGATSVPEPTSALLAALALTAGFVRRRVNG